MVLCCVLPGKLLFGTLLQQKNAKGCELRNMLIIIAPIQTTVNTPHYTILCRAIYPLRGHDVSRSD